MTTSISKKINHSNKTKWRGLWATGWGKLWDGIGKRSLDVCQLLWLNLVIYRCYCPVFWSRWDLSTSRFMLPWCEWAREHLRASFNQSCLTCFLNPLISTELAFIFKQPRCFQCPCKKCWKYPCDSFKFAKTASNCEESSRKATSKETCPCFLSELDQQLLKYQESISQFMLHKLIK